jgi:hypothetical protein
MERSLMLSASQVIPVRLVVWTVLLLVALVARGEIGRADSEASDVGLMRTAKERLGVKASDEQRVDDCKVPIELRGAKSWRDACNDSASTTIFVNCGPSTAQSVAVFNFELIDTSLEGAVRGARTDEQERLARVSDQLRELLRDSSQFSLVNLTPIASEAQASNLQACIRCDTRLARRIGAELSITGTVQKVSNLILNMNIYVRDASTGATIAAMSADMRGNTDESWSRTLNWLVRNRLLAPGYGLQWTAAESFEPQDGSGVARTRTELIIQLFKVIIGLAFGAYFVWWSLQVLDRLTHEYDAATVAPRAGFAPQIDAQGVSRGELYAKRCRAADGTADLAWLSCT